MIRTSIARLADEAPVPHKSSWAAGRPPSIAYDRVCLALEAEASATARAVIKMRARAYALRPRDLDLLATGLRDLTPRDLVASLRLIRSVMRWRPGGEVSAINLRGAMLYARYLRAKRRQLWKSGT